MPGRGRPFQKGQSGNPAGRPKQDMTITELARAHCPRAIEVLAELMNDPKATAAARAMAAEKLLDRGYGRPPQLAAVAVSDNRDVRDLTDEELLRIIASHPLFPASDEPANDAEPEERGDAESGDSQAKPH
jgi:hypothetical protein